jgi:hypothetical protein
MCGTVATGRVCPALASTAGAPEIDRVIDGGNPEPPTTQRAKGSLGTTPPT